MGIREQITALFGALAARQSDDCTQIGDLLAKLQHQQQVLESSLRQAQLPAARRKLSFKLAVNRLQQQKAMEKRGKLPRPCE